MQTEVSTAGGPPAAPVEIPADPPDALAPGVKAGPWVIERELGRGGMGAVYAVVHEDIGKRAALKLMHRRLASGSSAERILLEARVVNQVGHPNIVDIFETGELADGRPYIVMERLGGVPLSQRADQSKILPDQVIAILLQVCDALIAAHAAGIVHRDLKLDNVFLIDNPEDPAQPRVKLLDWGIAKVITGEPHHTIEGQLVGTPQYLAPEQARGAEVSPQTDVYSLGVMSYELFLEQLPFEAETSAEIMAMHLRASPPPPHELWPEIPKELEHLLLAMLAKAPEVRPSVLAVARAFEQIRAELIRRKCTVVTGERLAVPPEPEPQRPARERSAGGFASTGPAAWQNPGVRWQFAVGALALVTSATMFLVTRAGDSAAAEPPFPVLAPTRALATPVVAGPPAIEPRLHSGVLPAAHRASPVEPRPHSELLPAARRSPPAIEPHLHSEVLPAARRSPPAIADVVSAAPQLVAANVHSRATAPATLVPGTYPARAKRKPPVAPHRFLPIDPDGTIDPYQ
jgi:serine/threonine-protein kinase